MKQLRSQPLRCPESELFTLHMELDLNRGLHFHRITVQNIRLVLPLLDCFHGSLDKDWMPTYSVKTFDGASLANGCLQNHIALNVRNEIGRASCRERRESEGV